MNYALFSGRLSIWEIIVLARWRFAVENKSLPSWKNNIVPENVCEVGCGAGEILKQLSSSLPNANFVGYEISAQAFELCKIRVSEKTKCLNKNILEDDFFDCLLCIDVYERLEDYIAFIKSLKVKATTAVQDS